jgi:hypothetical protein
MLDIVAWGWDWGRDTADQKAVKSKWVFKHKADGHFHTCLVAKGFMQIPGLDMMKPSALSHALNHYGSY